MNLLYLSKQQEITMNEVTCVWEKKSKEKLPKSVPGLPLHRGQWKQGKSRGGNGYSLKGTRRMAPGKRNVSGMSKFRVNSAEMICWYLKKV